MSDIWDTSYENEYNGTATICECENDNTIRHNYFDASIVTSESTVDSSISGYWENRTIDEFDDKPTMAVLENGTPMKISVEHSNDILFGNKTIITGPVVIKNFIAECDNLSNIYQKNKHFDSPGSTDICN